jgi:hypothetical protein
MVGAGASLATALVSLAIFRSIGLSGPPPKPKKAENVYQAPPEKNNTNLTGSPESEPRAGNGPPWWRELPTKAPSAADTRLAASGEWSSLVAGTPDDRRPSQLAGYKADRGALAGYEADRGALAGYEADGHLADYNPGNPGTG